MTRVGAALALVVMLTAGQSAGQEPKAPAPAPAAVPGEDPNTPKTPGEAAQHFGLKYTPNSELIITSEEAEGVKAETGHQTVVFTKHVKTVQGDMNMLSDWLQAIYPSENAHRPDYITAKGSVTITQGTNVAHCVVAHVDNISCKADCRSEGNRARLERDTDDMEADVIYFDLCKGTVKAVGNVQVRVHQTQSDPNAPATGNTPIPGATPAPSPAPAKANGG